MVTLDIDQAELFVQIKGTASVVKQNRWLWVFLSNVGAQVVDESLIVVPRAARQLGPFIKQIEAALSKNSFEYSLSPALTGSLSDFLSEEARFVEFSNRAREIWNNNVQQQEFVDFTNVLSREFPERRLYPLQLLAAYHLAFSQNSANFSVPGAGKTSIVYGAYAYLKSLPVDHPKHVNKILVIGPLSSFGPWEDEFKDCFGRAPQARRVSGEVPLDERKRVFYSALAKYTNLELIMASYQSAYNGLEDIKHFLGRPDNKVMVVLDEAHKVKSTSGGAWAETVLQLSPFAAARVVLTGTPAPNGYEDLYNLFKFMWPNHSVIKFHLDHLRDMSQRPSDTRIETLINDISPFFIRIRKSDLKLPPPIEHPPHIVSFGEKQKKIYRFIEDKYMDYFKSRGSSSWVHDTLTRARLIRLMQAATNPALLRAPLDESMMGDGADTSIYVDDAEILHEVLGYEDSEVPSKFIEALKLVEKILAEDSSSKIVIWGVFINNLLSIQALLSKHDIDSRVLYGQTPTEADGQDGAEETRESIIREFGSPESRFRVIIANPFVIGESISLHKACRNAIYLERNFNAAAFLQSKDRIHRYGLPPDAVVNYHYIIAEGSIDETINRRLAEKEAAMLRVLDSRDIPLLSMNMELDGEDPDDIAAIIKDYASRSAKI